MQRREGVVRAGRAGSRRRTGPGSAVDSIVMSSSADSPVARLNRLGDTVIVLPAGASPRCRSAAGRRSRWSPRVSSSAAPGMHRRVDRRQVEVDGVERVGAQRGSCRRRLASNVRPGLLGDVEVDAAGAHVERIGRRRQVLLDDVGRRRRHQRRLDLARRPRTGAAPSSGSPSRRCAATTSTCRRSPGRTRLAGRRATPSSVGTGVCPARICTPGAVMSGLMKSPAGPRDENAAITSPSPSRLHAGGERRRRRRGWRS